LVSVVSAGIIGRTVLLVIGVTGPLAR